MNKGIDVLGNIFESVAAAAEEIARVNANDYVKDGLIYCGDCNTKKQEIIDWFDGSKKKVFVLCDCAIKQKRKEKEEIEKREFFDRIKKLRKMGFAEDEMQDWTFANDDNSNEHVSNIMRKYVDNFETMKENGKGLLLYGSVGTGKTYAAAEVVNALIDEGYPCLMTNFARLTNTISGMYAGKQEYIDGLNKFDLLVIDDLASERDTEFMGEIVQNIIDSRYRAGLPLIITTNLSTAELQNSNDLRKKRIYSRLFDMCLPVKVEGIDRRQKKLKNDFNQYKDLLGLD